MHDGSKAHGVGQSPGPQTGAIRTISDLPTEHGLKTPAQTSPELWQQRLHSKKIIVRGPDRNATRVALQMALQKYGSLIDAAGAYCSVIVTEAVRQVGREEKRSHGMDQSRAG